MGHYACDMRPEWFDDTPKKPKEPEKPSGMSRAAAAELAKLHAVHSKDRHAYMPSSMDEDWSAHEWVLNAIQNAYAAGQDSKK